MQYKNIKYFLLPLLFLFGLGCSKKMQEENPPPSFQLATITTSQVTAINQNSATSGGTIVSNGGATISESGICYSTTPNPTITNFKILSNVTSGNFVSNLNNLTANSSYYVKAYAVNSVGVAYGDQVVFSTLGPNPPPPQTPADTAMVIYVNGGNNLYAYNAANGAMKWKVNFGSTYLTQYPTPPFYSNSTIYISCENKLYAYDTLGNLKWSFTALGTKLNSPVVFNNNAYVADKTSIYAINATTGLQVWRTVPTTALSNTDFSVSGLVYSNNTLYINNFQLFAIDALNGIVKWVFNSPLPGYTGDVTPVIKDAQIYLAGGQDGNLFNINLINGGLNWVKTSGANLINPMALNISHGNIFVAVEGLNGGSGISVYDSATTNFKFKIPSFYVSYQTKYNYGLVPIVKDSILFVPTSPGVYSYNITTGIEIFNYNAVGIGTQISCPTIVGNAIFFGNRNTSYPQGYITARNVKDRSLIWKTNELDDFLFSIPCIVGKSGKIYSSGYTY